MLSKEWKKLCKECSTATEKAGLTKEDTDRIIKETREMQQKANKYDSLVEKMRDKKEWLIDNILNNDYASDSDKDIAEHQVDILQELLKEAEDE